MLINKATRFSTFTLSNAGISVALTLQAGYNLFTMNDFGIINVSPGYIPYFSLGTGKIAVDISGVTVLSDLMQSGTFAPLSSTANYRLYVRAIVSPSLKGIGLFHSYASGGTYTVSVTLSNILLGVSQTVSQAVVVTIPDQPITGLSLLTTYGSTVCYMSVSCGLQASVLTGTSIIYQFNIAGNVSTGNQSLVYNTFTALGTYSVNVTASNSVSSMSVMVSIVVANQMYGLSFKAGTLPYSSSIVSQPANFLFMILVGANYQCLINYGDGATQTISDAIYYINNTYVSHTYTAESAYTVSINCTNPVNSLSLTFTHYVQYPLVGLALVSNGTLLNTAYTVRFSVTSGSVPYSISFSFDGILDSGVQYSNLLGQSSSHAGESTPAIHTIFINMTNYVSSIQLNCTFQVSSPLQNVQFSISPSSGISAYTYQYPVTLSLITSMTSGSNVDIFVNADSLATVSTLPNNTVNVQTLGTWVNPNTIAYTYANPGAYTLNANVSNSLVYYVFNQAIKIISLVDYLIPNLSTNSNKLVFQSFDGGVTGTALAQFVFNYQANTKAGSDAYVTFWPGDATNSSFGPFLLNMDFNANVSRSPLQYTYTALGNYTAVFYVTNPLGSKYFTFTFTVVYSLLGFYVDVVPSYTQVNSPVNVNAYLIQGTGVSYSWFNGATMFASAAKTCLKQNLKILFINISSNK